MAWIGLEINLIRFAPLLINKITNQSVEAAIKYFLIQAIASTILIFSTLLTHYLFSINLNQDLYGVITLALTAKAGLAPLHYWFPQVIELTNWFQSILIITWQKIAPLVLLSYSFNNFVYIIIISSALVGSLGGINQMFIKKIITYSSIAHSAWILTILQVNEFIWLFYFVGYSFISILIIIICLDLSVISIKKLFISSNSYFNKLIISINFLSLAGIPPFLGFFIKIRALIIILNNKYRILILITLITSSFISFYFYLRIIYSSLFLMTKTSIYTIDLSKSILFKNFSFYLILSIFGNLIIPLLVLLT
jgi:NADH-ubiquinone oxidoreductase chain 2